MSLTRRDFLKTSTLGSLAFNFSLGSFYLQAASTDDVVWGGTGFNVQYDEIPIKLSNISNALEASAQTGWANWNDRLYGSLKSNFRGDVLFEPGQKISAEDDPGLIFSLG